MRKDRDCGVPYPIYTPYQGMGMPMGMPMPMNYQTTMTTTKQHCGLGLFNSGQICGIGK